LGCAAERDDGKRFIVRADEKLTAFVELERQVLTVTFYLESIHAPAILLLFRKDARIHGHRTAQVRAMHQND